MKKNSSNKNFLLNLIIIVAVVIGAYSYFKPPTYQSLVAKWKDDKVQVEVFESLTSQLLNEAIIYDKAGSETKAKAKEELQNTVVQRREYTAQMMKSKPKEFLKNAINDELSGGLLKNLDGLEKKTTIEGELSIICTVLHDANNSAKKDEVVLTTYQIFANNGEVYDLYMPDETVLENLNPGDKIKATGYELDGNFVPDTLSDSKNFATITKGVALPNATNNKVAVVLLNDSYANTYKMATKEQWTMIMTKMKEYFEEVSFGQMTISGKNNPSAPADIFGYYTMNAQTSCDYMVWLNDAKAAAAKGGFSETGYRHVMYIIPKIQVGGQCMISGVAYVGSVVSWYNAYKHFGSYLTSGTFDNNNAILGQPNGFVGISDLLAHELGHNLGFMHARKATCTDANGHKVQVSDNCTYAEYGDPWDTMGNGWNLFPGHYSAFNKNAYLGWIPASRVKTITTNGTYDLYPLEYAGTGAQMLHIPVTYKNASGVNTTFNYYLDFRADYGFDKYSLFSKTDAMTGVAVRTATKGSYTNLYFANPASGSQGYNSTEIGVQPGKSFYDPIRKVEFKTISSTGGKAVVQVTFNGNPPNEPCVRNAATVSVSPMSVTKKAGEGNSYIVYIKNNDSYGCGASNFQVKYDLPSNFTSDYGSYTLSVLPGENSPYASPVYAKVSTPDGTYPISINIKNVTTGNTQILNPTFTVAGGQTTTCVSSNPTVSFSPTTATGKPGDALSYTLSIKNNDNTICAASNYTIAATLPTGFTIDSNNLTATISPGATYTKVFKITSGATIANGNYTIPFAVKNTTLNTTSTPSVVYTVSAPTCVRGEPAVSFSPTTASGNPGTALSYTLTLKNNDNTSCAASNYTIAATLPTGFTIDSNNVTTTVNPGASYSKVFKVTSSMTSTNGSYQIPFVITNTTLKTTKSSGVTYTVTGAVTCKEVAPTISVSPTTQTGEVGTALSYTLNIKNNDVGCPNKTYSVTASIPSGFKIDVSSYSVTLASGSSTTKVFKMTPQTGVVNGIYSLSLAISEGTNRYSAAGTYNVITYIAVPPSVNITGLTNNQKLGSGNTNVVASASHSKGIAAINIYLNTVKVATCNNPSKGECKYGINANKIISGTYVLKVEAIANDSTKTSNSKTITFIR